MSSQARTARPEPVLSPSVTRVLIIAADLEDARLLTQLLEWTPPFDADVSCVTSLAEAIGDIARAPPALILLEFGLPGANGIDTIGLVRQHAGDTPLVLLCTSEEEDEALHAIHVGAQDYLVKGHYGDRALIRTLRLAQERTAILTELQTVRLHAHHSATHDMLTGLPNRQLFRERIRAEVDRAAATGTAVAVLLIGLNRFKTINDTLGHVIGDELLRVVGSRLRRFVIEPSIVARVGGDEFGLLLTAIVDSDDVCRVAARAIAALRKPVVIQGHAAAVNPSVGIAISSDVVDGEDALVRCADLALRGAKGRRDVAYELYSERRHRLLVERRTLEHTLASEIDLSQLFVHYQPQVDSTTGQLIGIEALVRWNHETLGALQPDRFIDVAEETGGIVAIGQHVLRTACQQLVEWHRLGHTHLTMSVNASLHELLTGDFATTVQAILRETGLNPKSLVIEVTERSIVVELDAVIATLLRLRALGVAISIDDFGRGASSLHALANLPKDELKIDQSFVSRCTLDRDSDSIITAILFMADRLGLRVIAEGVERKEQLDFLHGQGCTRLQGFLFWRPLAAAQVTELLSSPHAAISARDVVWTDAVGNC